MEKKLAAIKILQQHTNKIRNSAAFRLLEIQLDFTFDTFFFSC